MLRVNSLLLLFCIGQIVQGVKDWLINDIYSFSNVTLTKCKINGLACLELSNELISRKFLLSPNFATIEYNTHLQEPYNAAIRAMVPEAQIGLNGRMYGIGGIEFKSNVTHSYLNLSWINPDNVQTNTSYSFQFVSYEASTDLYKPYEWIPGTRHSPKDIPWPPLGLALEATFAPPANAPAQIQVISCMCDQHKTKKIKNKNIQNIRVIVRYEMLQGMPIMTKMLRITSVNATETDNVWITYVEPELLCVNPPFSSGSWGGYQQGLLFLDTDIAHSSEIQWYTQPGQSQSPGSYQPCVRVFYAPQSEQSVWAVRLAPELPGTENGTFQSFRVLELMSDSKSIADMERFGMGQRRLMKYLTPCIMENPIYTQTTNLSDEMVYRMIDQCNETGFELMAFSFGCGFNMENTSQANLDHYQTLIEYATSKNVIVGGYDLIDMARNVTEYIGGRNVLFIAVISFLLFFYCYYCYVLLKKKKKKRRIDTNPNVHDTGECYASGWSDVILGYFENYIEIGMGMVITDGPYPGFSCASLTHKYHDNLNDSVFRQQYLQNQFYIQMKAQNVYVHTPDNYYYVGGNRNKFPYAEYTYTLPLWEEMVCLICLLVYRLGKCQ
ncbi:hypothetical protein RFI_00489 [Reticulomyxa filosa]|uniref:Uncharacterized protein n=1 Tax=Reticulomyxa filosa TaxID=46433 RepID=X6PEP0_RETFI|nr:hypothetical protein RFI_00489 [Reticulomyxa filosa]|eukprot:ETO36573.1 hypothetical protein RFI_00489 [Reticulomyxa filosa]